MSQAMTIPNPSRELALQPPQPRTRSPGWGPRGPRPALHVPAPAAGSVLGVRQRRMKLRQEMQGASPLRSGIGILVPNKHQLLHPQTTLGLCASSSRVQKDEESPFSPKYQVFSPSNSKRAILKPYHQCFHQEKNAPDDFPTYIQPS